MGAGAEFRDFANAFAASSRGRFKSKAEREMDAIQLEEAKLRLDALRRAAETYPEDREIQKQKDKLELEYAKMRNDAAKKAAKEAGESDPANDPDYKPSTKEPPLIGPGSSMDAPGPFLGGSANDNLMNQPGEAAKSYVAPVTGTFANKSSNRYLAARSGGKRLHSGVDLNAANGSTVVAPIAGTVVSVGYDPGGYDHYVVLLGADGYAQRIANHGRVTVRRGDTVSAGDPLGVVGRGHVHWEIIAPGSGAYKALAGGGRASTQSHRGVYPTVDLSGFFDLQYGSQIVAGQPLGTGGTAVAARGIPHPGLVGGTAADTLESVSEWNRRNDPEHPGSLINRIIGGGGHIDEHMGQPPWDPLVRESTGGGATAIPAPWGGGVDQSGGPNDFARATGRTGHVAEELPSGVTIKARAETTTGAPNVTPPAGLDGAPPVGTSASTLPRAGGAGASTGGARGLAGTGAYSNEGGTAGSRYGGRGLTKLSGEDRQAVLDVSSQLGIAPSHLLSVIGYETIGTYSPDITSPTGYMGLIQFGPNEQKKFGVKKGMSFSAQLRGPVVDYLKSRGLKPGMGLPELYSIINAGSLRKDGTPRWGAHDANGDLRHHLTLISRNYAPGAMAWLGGTQLDTTTPVGVEGKPIPTPTLRPRAAIPTAEAPSAIPPSSGLGMEPLSPNIPPLSGTGTAPYPPANLSTRPTISPVSSMQMGGGFGGFGGFQSATGRMGAIGQNLELPQPFRMAKGGVVPSVDDIARATGRTGNPQTAGELPSDAPDIVQRTERDYYAPAPPSSPDAEFNPGLEADGFDPNGSVMDSGHFATKVGIEKIFDMPSDPGLSGGSGTDVTEYGGGAGPDVVDDGSGDTGGDTSGGDTGGGGGTADDSAPAPDTDVTGAPVSAAGEGAIPTPGMRWDTLPALKKTDPDIAKYIADQEEKIDPDHNMPETQRHLYALGLIYNHFRTVKHNPLAAERVAREAATYWAQQYNMYQAIAEEALASGNMDDATTAAIKAWNYIPDNRTLSVDKEHHGFKVTYTDNAGKTVVEQTLTPQEIAGKILGMNPKTFYEQIVAAGGGHLPSKAFSAALEEIDSSGKMSEKARAAVNDPGEMDYLLKHLQAVQKVGANESAADTAAAAAERRKVSADINKAYAKDKILPTADQLARADDATRNIFTPLLEKADKASKTTEKVKTLQRAFDEYNNTGHISSKTAADVAAFDGGTEEVAKFISENEAADKVKRDKAAADRDAANNDRSVIDWTVKQAQPPGGMPTVDQLSEAHIPETGTALVGGLEAQIPDRKPPLFDPQSTGKVNDLLTNLWTWNRDRGFTAGQAGQFIAKYLQTQDGALDTTFQQQDDPNNGPNTKVMDRTVPGMFWIMPKGVQADLDSLRKQITTRNLADQKRKAELDSPKPVEPAYVADPFANPAVANRLPPPEARPSTVPGPVPPRPAPNNDPMFRRMPPRPAGP